MTRWLARAIRTSPDLQRLAQGIERLRLELGQLVEEEHAVMGERDLARAGVEAAADERRHGGRVVRGAERPPVRQGAVGEVPGDRLDHRHLEQFARRQRRQDRGQPVAPASTCQRQAGRS